MYTSFPTTLYIKNLKPEVAEDARVNLWNTGLEAACPCGAGEALQAVEMQDLIPACNVKEYAGTIQIPVYGNRNQYYTLKAGEEITVTCGSDAEAMFYLQMANDMLRVEETAAPVEEEVEEDVPAEDEEVQG